MAKGKGELAVEISPARLLGVPAHILTHQLHCAVGGHSCISHVAEAQDCSATPPPSTSTSPPDSSSRCLCQTVAARLHLTLTSNPVKAHSAPQGCLDGWQHVVVGHQNNTLTCREGNHQFGSETCCHANVTPAAVV